MEFRFTEYFESQVLRKRPYLRKKWCIGVVNAPLRCEPQGPDRFRFWAAVPELGGRYLRVVTLEDKVPFTTPSPTEDSGREAQLLPGNRFTLH